MRTLKITGITQLRDDLLKVYELLRTKKMNADTVKPIVDTASKIMKSARIEIEYQALMKTKRKIPFIEK